MKRLAVLLLVVAGMIALSEAHWYALYREKWQGGWREQYDTDNGCREASASVASVDTGGGCILLCDRSNCKGRCVRVKPGEGSDCADHGDFGTCDFHRKTKSAKGC